MDNTKESLVGGLFGSAIGYMRRFIFRVLSVGPIPNHLAFILDGNRRYARKWNLGEGMGHGAGFLSLMLLMKHCYELGVKYVTVYAFSIDNFRRKPDEVQGLMDLMLEKIEVMIKEASIVNQYGVRVFFIGDLNLLSETVRLAAEKAMKATSKNDKIILLICVAYTSTDEIVHAAQESCQDKWREIQSIMKTNDDAQSGENDEGKLGENHVIKLADIERNMYMGVAPDPDILIRSSGETRLSNFLLWQTSNSLLYSPKALWPEFGFHHLVWAVLNFQRVHTELQKRRKKQL